MKKQYSNIDHGEWMQKFLDRKKLSSPKEFVDAPEKLNEFQRKVLNILGIVADGLMNLPMELNRQARGRGFNWNVGGGGGMAMGWTASLSTFDSDQLTMLVFLCHEARIRLEIQPSPNSLRLTFWQRKAEGGGMVRHPNLNEAVKEFHKWFKSNHLISYKETTDAQDSTSTGGENSEAEIVNASRS